VKIPKGANIILNLYSFNYMDDIFYSPEEFLPERWENSDLNFLSFGFGARSCFGRKFASEQMMIFLFMILQKFEIFVVPEHPIESFFNLGIRPKNEQVWIRLKSIEI